MRHAGRLHQACTFGGHHANDNSCSVIVGRFTDMVVLPGNSLKEVGGIG